MKDKLRDGRNDSEIEIERKSHEGLSTKIGKESSVLEQT